MSYNELVFSNFCSGAENTPKIVSKLLEFAEQQGFALTDDDKSVLEQLQVNLKDKDRLLTLVLPKAQETVSLLDRLVVAMPVEWYARSSGLLLLTLTGGSFSCPL